MLRKLAGVLLLVGAGVAIAMFLRHRPTATDQIAFEPRTDASAEVRIGDLEKALAAQIDRARLLEARIAGLEERLQGAQRGGAATGEGPARPRGADGEFPAGPREPFGQAGQADLAAVRERQRERRLERLVQAGFTRERAEWIERRSEELEWQAMQAQYDSQGGRPGVAQVDVQRALRSELGDSEYERYLRGTGRPTEVQVLDVLASSAAERAGLKPGDQILSYAGTRVFDMRELNALTREGNPGESVTVEVKRNGQSVQLTVPRGALGVSGGGMRGPPGGGPPGGPPDLPRRFPGN